MNTLLDVLEQVSVFYDRSTAGECINKEELEELEKDVGTVQCEELIEIVDKLKELVVDGTYEDSEKVGKLMSSAQTITRVEIKKMSRSMSPERKPYKKSVERKKSLTATEEKKSDDNVGFVEKLSLRVGQVLLAGTPESFECKKVKISTPNKTLTGTIEFCFTGKVSVVKRKIVSMDVLIDLKRAICIDVDNGSEGMTVTRIKYLNDFLEWQSITFYDYNK